MLSDSFEIMKLWIPLKLNFSTDKSGEMKKLNFVYCVPVDDEATTSAWRKASELAKEGWELVSAIPITASFFPASQARDLPQTYTAGYELLFKRRMPVLAQ